MNRRWIAASAAILMAFAMAVLALAPKAEPAYEAPAAAMALMECGSGEMIAGKNCDMPLPMASTTKIMTALIVLENCGLDELVSVPDEAVGTEGSSIYLHKGERMTVRDLLCGLMLASGNDAAVALAVHVGGSVSGFVDMMNERAEKLGLEKTHFVTPNGLHADRHLTTAKELCLIAREAMKNEEFRTIVSMKYYRAESGDTVRTFKNKNALLWDYEGAFGIKTGYTKAAGRCLVFGAERNGMMLIGCLLDCGPMFETAAALMDRAFGEYSVQTVVEGSKTLFKAKVENGGENLLEVEAECSIMALMRNGEERSFRLSAELEEGLRAPISSGERVGMLSAYDENGLVGQAPLIAANGVERAGFGFWWRLITSLFAA